MLNVKSVNQKYQYNCVEHKREYNTWHSMRRRCLNKFNHNYHLYGGRGIIICNRWLQSFDNFVEDMGRRPDNTTIDRINNDGNYEPSNCRWATPKEQNRNASFARTITDTDGEELCLDDFARKHNVSRSTVAYRLDKGATIEQAKLPPLDKHIVVITFMGTEYGFRELKRQFQFAENTYRRRVRAGYSHEKALCEVFNKKGIRCTEYDFMYETFDFEYNSLK